jgi:hypothetical protein
MKLVASALLAAPACVLLLFAIGEMASGDASGVQHIPEALPLLLLVVAAWRYPRWTGIALLTLGTMLLGVWLVWIFAGGHTGRGEIVGWFAAAVIFFGLPLVAGWLLLRASRRTT